MNSEIEQILEFAAQILPYLAAVYFFVKGIIPVCRLIGFIFRVRENPPKGFWNGVEFIADQIHVGGIQFGIMVGLLYFQEQISILLLAIVDKYADIAMTAIFALFVGTLVTLILTALLSVLVLVARGCVLVYDYIQGYIRGWV